MKNTFTLIGYPATVFRIVRRYFVLGDVPCVHGISTCGRYQTCARIADVVMVEG